MTEIHEEGVDVDALRDGTLPPALTKSELSVCLFAVGDLIWLLFVDGKPTNSNGGSGSVAKSQNF